MKSQNSFVYPTDTLVDPSFFNSSELLVSWKTGFCAVRVVDTDTTFAPCYFVTYRDHYETSIDLCPDNLDSVGGVGLFNGDPRLLDSALFADMETDGSDIIADDGYHIRNFNLTTSTKTYNEGGGSKYCIEADLYEGTDNTWYQEFQIMMGPISVPKTSNYHTAETIGVLVNGMVLEHTPPSSESTTALSGGIIPIDRCGWHPEPAGFGHFHTVPYGINASLESNGVESDYYCNDIDQKSFSGLAGFTFSGVPIYGPYDEGETTAPTDLDDCYGHTHQTADFDEPVYHYHISATDIVNNPPCYDHYIPLEENRFIYGEWTETGSAPDVPASIDGLTSVCADQTGVTYSITDVSGASTYNWTVPTDATITDGDGTNTITVTFGGTVGDVCVNAQNAYGTSDDKCITVAASVCSTIPDVPGAITGLTSVCPNQPGVSYSIDAVSGADFYVWTLPTGASIVSGDSTTEITVNFGTTFGDVCVKAGNDIGNSKASCQTITQGTCGSTPDTPGAITGLTDICPNQPNVTYTIDDVTGATSYVWTIPSDATIASGDGTTTIIINFGDEVGDVCVAAKNGVGTSATSCLTTEVCDGGGTTAVTEWVENESLISVHPNPTTDFITIAGEFDELTIFDIQGSTVYYSSEKTSNDIVIDVTKYEPGVYFINAQQGENVMFEKIIVE